MQSLIEKVDIENITETLVVILDAIKQNADSYTLLISENGDPSFLDRVIMDSYKTQNPKMKELLPTLTVVNHDWFFNFITHGYTSILIFWINNGMKEDSLEVAQFINKLNTTILKDFH